MNIDDVTARYEQEIGAATGRNDRHVAESHEAHDKAVADAERARDRALRVAAGTLDEALAKHHAAHERALANATEKFDTSARNVLGVPESLYIRDQGTSVMQVCGPDKVTVYASATYMGPAGWSVDGPDGRQFLDPSARNRCRAMLWQIAATLAVAA